MHVQVATTPSLCDVIDATSFCCFYFYKGMADAVVVDVIHTVAMILQSLNPTSSNQYRIFAPEFIDDLS